MLGAWGPFSRKVWTDGAAYSDDWGADVGVFVGDSRAEVARATAVVLGLSRAIAVRLDERAAIRHYLVVVGDWLDRGDLAAMRLFGAQVAAALDAARIIADLSRRNAELAALNRLGAIAGDAADLPSFFSRAADLVRTATGCDGLGVYVLDDRAGDWSAASTTAPRTLRRTSPASRSPRRSGTSCATDCAGGRGPTGRPRRRPRGEARLRRERLGAARRALAGGGRDDGGLPGRAGACAGAPRRARRGAAHFAGAIESHGLLADLRRRVGAHAPQRSALASAQLDPGSCSTRRCAASATRSTRAAPRSCATATGSCSSRGRPRRRRRAAAQLAVGDGAPGSR
jgi:hypothetical protein